MSPTNKNITLVKEVFLLKWRKAKHTKEKGGKEKEKETEQKRRRWKSMSTEERETSRPPPVPHSDGAPGAPDADSNGKRSVTAIPLVPFKF